MFTPNTLPLILVVLLIYFILLIAPTSLYVEAAREKGYYRKQEHCVLIRHCCLFSLLLLWGYMSPDWS